MEKRQQISFFLTVDDEVRIAAEVGRTLPGVELVDECHWKEVGRPPVRKSPVECGGVLGLWNSRILPELVGVARPNGRIDGPMSGAVVQWLRCYVHEGKLEFGHWRPFMRPMIRM